MEKRTITIPEMITVGELAEKVDVTVTQLIGELMKNGIMATLNQKIDIETAQIILDELSIEVQLERESQVPTEAKQERELSDKAVERPPIIAVMGHVDHGKTTLLDAIRGAEVADGEAGGITQHLSAYQVVHATKDGKKRPITFLDTPGHEAFAALRQHGAELTDVAVIVVAADDGVKPQTVEAIKFAEQAGVKMIVAMNKMDREGADPNRVKQQLSEHKLLTEEWGGDTVVVEVSAKNKTGIDKLLDMILLVADVEELKAEADIPAEGLVIESHNQVGRGPVVTLLVQHGFIKKGDFLVAGSTYAKIRTLEDYAGKELKNAGPSTPATVTGFKNLPKFGNQFTIVNSEKEARKAAEKGGVDGVTERTSMTSSELLSMINKATNTSEVPLIVKADVQGSLTSVLDSLHMLDNDEISIRIVGSGVGDITENDIRMAETSQAVIYGFNVNVPANVKRLAAKEKVSIRVFKIIYELIDDARTVLGDLLEPEIVETEVGRLVIKGVFRTTKSAIICGGEVTKGKVVPRVLAKVIRKKEEIAEVEVEKVQRQQQDAKEVFEGEMCGLQLATKTKVELEEGDRLELFTREEVARTL